MSLITELKKELIAAHMLGSSGAANVDFSDLNDITLSDIPLEALFQQDYSLPSNALAQTVSRYQSGTANSALLVTQRASAYSVPLIKGMSVSSITFHSSGTALGAGTFQKFALCDINGNLLRATNNDGATAWGTETPKTLNLTIPYDVTDTGMYYLVILVAATTVPSLRAVASNNYDSSLLANNRMFKPAGTTTLTNLADIPNPVVLNPNGTSGIAYAFCS